MMVVLLSQDSRMVRKSLRKITQIINKKVSLLFGMTMVNSKRRVIIKMES